MRTRYRNATDPEQNRTIGLHGAWLEPGAVSAPVHPLSDDHPALRSGALVAVTDNESATPSAGETGGASEAAGAPEAPAAAAPKRKRTRKRKQADAPASSPARAALAELSLEALYAEAEGLDAWSASGLSWDDLEALPTADARSLLEDFLLDANWTAEG